MGDDRDRRVPKTPPTGISEQIADGAALWSEDENTAGDGNTPVGAESLERMQRRVKQTNITTTQTLTGLDILRQETKVDINRIEGKVERIDDKVDKLSDHVATLGTQIGAAVGKVDVLVDVIQDDRRANQDRKTISFEAHVGVDSQAKIAKIKDDIDIKQTRRAFWYGAVGKFVKGAIGVGVAAATVAVTLLAEHC